MKINNSQRWYRLKFGVHIRRLADVEGHDIFMNAPIPAARKPALEGWEVRWNGRDIGIVWASRGDWTPWAWSWADVSMQISPHKALKKRHAVSRLAAARLKHERERDRAPERKAAPDLDDFQI